MTKTEAIQLLGGTVRAAATEIGVKPQAIAGWPDALTRKTEDRVLAALWRRQQKAAQASALVPAGGV
jgi:hypothetical protein